MNIDRWTTHSDHVISGCDWVDYMHHWDTLMSAHFSIDIESIRDKYLKEREKIIHLRFCMLPIIEILKGLIT